MAFLPKNLSKKIFPFETYRAKYRYRHHSPKNVPLSVPLLLFQLSIITNIVYRFSLLLKYRVSTSDNLDMGTFVQAVGNLLVSYLAEVGYFQIFFSVSGVAKIKMLKSIEYRFRNGTRVMAKCISIRTPRTHIH